MAPSESPKQVISPKLWFYGFVAVMVLGGGLLFLQSKPSTTTAHLEVIVPDLQGEEIRGHDLFHAKCRTQWWR